MTGRYARENFNRAAYERELVATREVLDGPKVSVPATAAELYELERLIRRYPDHARRLVAELPPPAATFALTERRGRERNVEVPPLRPPGERDSRPASALPRRPKHPRKE